jgi:hypothetical protein
VNANHEQNLRLLDRRQHDGEAVAGSVSRVSARRGARFGEGIGMWESATDLSASSLPRGLRHSAKYQRHPRLIATTNQFQVSTRHTQRRDQPLIAETMIVGTLTAETGESAPGDSGSGRLQTEAGCGRSDFRCAHIGREHAEIGVTGVCDGGSQIDGAVSARTPAASARPTANVPRVFEFVQLTVGQRGERLDK